MPRPGGTVRTTAHRPLSGDYGIDDDDDEFETVTTSDLKSLRKKVLQAELERKRIDVEKRRWEFERLQKENEVVELELVEQFISRWFTEGRNILDGLPVKLKRFGPEVFDAADQEMRYAIHAIHKKSLRLVEIRDD